MADKDYTFKQFADGLQLVASAGTREALVATSTKIRMVEIQALPENTGVVVVGPSTCVAAAATRRGIALVPGQSVSLRIDDLADIYVDSVVSAEGVSFLYFWD